MITILIYFNAILKYVGHKIPGNDRRKSKMSNVSIIILKISKAKETSVSFSFLFKGHFSMDLKLYKFSPKFTKTTFSL